MLDSDELTCTKCKSMFNTADKLPRLLPECGHTFCAACISALLKSSAPGAAFLCPEDGYIICLT